MEMVFYRSFDFRSKRSINKIERLNISDIVTFALNLKVNMSAAYRYNRLAAADQLRLIVLQIFLPSLISG